MTTNRVTEPFDFFAHGSLPAPQVSVDEAGTLASSILGTTVHATSLGSQQDANFLLSRPDASAAGVLKIANPAFPLTEIEAQDLAAEHLAARLPRLRFPTRVWAKARPLTAGTARILTYLPGGTLNGSDYLGPEAIRELGRIAGVVVRELGDFAHDGANRTLQWDLQHSGRILQLLSPAIPDEHRRALVERVLREVLPVVEALADELPQQVIHGDITDDNVVCRADSAQRLPDGVIDFGDLSRTWAIAELAVTISSMLHHEGFTPFTALDAVTEFNRVRPLSDAEADALWPLVVLRGAVLVASGNQQVALDGGSNGYAVSALEREWQILAVATSVPLEVMQKAVRAALGRPKKIAALPEGHGLLVSLPSSDMRCLDFSTQSEALDAGRWLDPSAEESLAAEALDAGALACFTRFDEYRLTRSAAFSRTVPATAPTGVDIWFSEPVTLMAPWAGSIQFDAAGLTLRGTGHVLRLSGPGLEAEQPWGGAIEAGAKILNVLPRARVRVTTMLSTGPVEVPGFVVPDAVAAWQSIVSDPSALLAIKTPTSSADITLLERRDASFATLQEHYYATPPQIERGWGEHLQSTTGRSYLDMVNNVAVLGHGHLGLADAVASQLRKLNTNSRFNYEAVVDFSEQLAATLPDALDTVFLVNSGSEANDLAIRIAMAASGRRDVVALAEAYHGWTYAADAVSTAVADNPNALGSRPEWVHTVDAPNAYRGKYRGANASQYAVDAVSTIEDLSSAGQPPAAFISETYYGNAGGMPLPDGYLQSLYAAVRGHGGYAIADEVQVGYGRLGEWFWGFEQQNAVPDIVTIAKAMGNGHPLGAVITTREIAETYRTQGYFFSSAGGSPVSSIVGSTVLREIQDTGLQENAREVGSYLKGRLKQLMDRHELIGAVHGSGMYLGVELVRDRQTLEPATEEAARICERLLDLGVVIQPTSDRLCVLKVKPPLILERSGADFFVDALDHALSTGF